MKRRELLKGLTTASVVAAIAQHSWATEQDKSRKIVDYLFVQNAQEVALKNGVLTLKGVTHDTLYFPINWIERCAALKSKGKRKYSVAFFFAN